MRTLRTLAGSILIALTPYAAAQTAATVDTETQVLNSTAENHGQTQVATRIATDFTTLAGSSDNALALVRALRNAMPVTLTSTTTTTAGTSGTTAIGGGTTTGGTGASTGGATSTSTTFTPPTGKMGWGNVFISLALAQDSLARLGITKPTSQQLQAALVGGSVTGADGTSTTLKGVLTMRADGMGWGQIAQALGTKLGPVVSAIKSAHVKVEKLPAATASSTTTASGTAKSTKATTTTATASSSSGSKGITTAGGVASTHASYGLTTAGSASAARGQGIVNAAGGSGAGVTAAAGHGHGQGNSGVVSAAGGAASSGATNAGGTTGGDSGKGNGKGRGGG